VATLAFVVLFQADRRDVPWVMAGVAVAFYGGRAGVRLLGPELGAFVGAAAISAFGNGYSRLLQRPASVPTVPGLLLLVPGSLGFHSVSSLMGKDALQGVEAAFAMSLVAVSLATGLLVGNVILPVHLDPDPGDVA